jgi:hypothetical protein
VECIGPELPGDDKYFSGGVLAANGRAIFPPYRAGQVLCVDTESRKVECIGPELPGGDAKYSSGGVLAANGTAIFPPSSAGQVLCVETWLLDAT